MHADGLRRQDVKGGARWAQTEKDNDKSKDFCHPSASREKQAKEEEKGERREDKREE